MIKIHEKKVEKKIYLHLIRSIWEKFICKYKNWYNPYAHLRSLTKYDTKIIIANDSKTYYMLNVVSILGHRNIILIE